MDMHCYRSSMEIIWTRNMKIKVVLNHVREKKNINKHHKVEADEIDRSLFKGSWLRNKKWLL